MKKSSRLTRGLRGVLTGVFTGQVIGVNDHGAVVVVVAVQSTAAGSKKLSRPSRTRVAIAGGGDRIVTPPLAWRGGTRRSLAISGHKRKKPC